MKIESNIFIRSINRLLFAMMVCVLLLTGGSFAHAETEDVDPGSRRLNGIIENEFFEANNLFTATVRYRTYSKYNRKYYTHATSKKGLKLINGIDISQFNPVTDFNAVKKDGIKFAIIRLGMRYVQNGVLASDSSFEYNIEGALDADMKVGVYFYSQATTEKEAIAEANYVLEHLDGYPLSMPIMFDLEFFSQRGPIKGRLYNAHLTKQKMTNVVLAFCKTIDEAGYPVMLYSNPDMLINHLYPSQIDDKYDIWLANYTTKAIYTGDYEMWQYGSVGCISGISGNVDCNFWYTEDEDIYEDDLQVQYIGNKYYTGKKIYPDITVVDSEGAYLCEGLDYKVSYENNKKIGKASVRVDGIGDYDGYSKTVYFNIVAKPPTYKQGVIKSKTVLRKTASTKSKQVLSLKKKQIVYESKEVTKNGKKYYYIKTKSGNKWYYGYVLKSKVKLY